MGQWGSTARTERRIHCDHFQEGESYWVWELPWHLPALSRWKDPCESSPEPTATSLGKYYPRNTVWFQTRTRHYGDDFLCPSGPEEMQGTRAWPLLGIYRPYQAKAFDSVNREALWAYLARLVCPPKCVSITRQIHEGMKGCALYDGDQSGSFNINTGVNQGCVIAPTLFSIFLAAFISLAAVDQAKGVGIIDRTDGELFNMRRLKAKTRVKSNIHRRFAIRWWLCYCCPHGGRPTEHPWCIFSSI